MIQYKVYANDGRETFILGRYTYKWVAWLRGQAYILAKPGRSVFIDTILTNDY